MKEIIASMSPDIRVLIADDHPIFRHGLRQLIEKQSGLAVIAEAANGASALELIGAHQPDVAVLDINLPGNDGFYVARSVLREHAPVRVIFLTMYKDEVHLNEALNLGVAGYVIKESAASDIGACIRAVMAGQKYVSAELSTYLLNRSAGRSSRQAQQGDLRELTVTERRVLALVAAYKTNREIATELFVSVRTIENHRASICSKLKLQGTHALMKFALKHEMELS